MPGTAREEDAARGDREKRRRRCPGTVRGDHGGDEARAIES